MSTSFDIEEIAVDSGVGASDDNERNLDRAFIFPKSKAKSQHGTDVDEAKVTVPGTQKIFIKTYGCSHNVSDR